MNAEIAGFIGGIAGVEVDRDTGHRHGGRPCIDHLDPVRERGALHVGEVDVRDVADRRHRVAGYALDLGCWHRGRTGWRGRGLDIGFALAGFDDLAVDRAAQPFLHGGLNLGWRHRSIGCEFLFVEVRIVRIEQALGKGAGLAVHLLQTLDATSGILCHDPVDFVLGRTIGHQVCKHGIHPGSHSSGISTGLDVGRVAEEADPLEVGGTGADARGGLVATNEGIVEAGGGQSTQNRGTHRQRHSVRIVQAGYGPRPADTGLGDAVLEDILDRGRQSRDVGFGRRVHGTARDGPEILVHQGAGGRLVDVTRQHHDRIVGTIFVAEPVAYGFKAGGIEIGHRADGRVAIGVTDREQRLLLCIGAEAVGLVVALPLFVLDDAALQIEHFLPDLAQQEAHAVALKEQGLLQGRYRYGLEIVGAVEPCRAVQARGPGSAQGLDVAGGRVFGAAKHQVFEQVSKAGRPCGLVLGSDIVPDRYGHDRSLAVGVDDDPQPVVELELGPGNVDLCDQFRNRRTLQGSGLNGGDGSGSAFGRRADGPDSRGRRDDGNDGGKRYETTTHEKTSLFRIGPGGP